MIQLRYKVTLKHISAASRYIRSKGMGHWFNLLYNLIIRHCTHPWSTLAQIFMSRAVAIIGLAKISITDLGVSTHIRNRYHCYEN